MDDAFYGTIIPWPADFAPRNWAFCDGRILAVSDNPELYSLLGARYGGNGQTTFALPDLRGRTIIGSGYGPGLSPSPLAYVTGQEYVDAAAVLPQHTHKMPPTGMTANLATAQMKITANEMNLNLNGTYGVPITSSSSDATGMPTDSEHYLGTPKMPNGSPLNTYNASTSEPTVTTKPTTISVSGKATPTINASISGSASVNDASSINVSETGISNCKIPLTQPSLSLNYIICINGLYPSRP